MKINMEGIDPLVTPLVKYFNANGLHTRCSCQGHNKTNMSMFYIEFEDDVTEDSIKQFMMNHLDWTGAFCSCGRFAQRMFCFANVTTQRMCTYLRWCYFAATPEAAMDDLERWITKRDGWEGFDGERYKKFAAGLCANLRKGKSNS